MRVNDGLMADDITFTQIWGLYSERERERESDCLPTLPLTVHHAVSIATSVTRLKQEYTPTLSPYTLSPFADRSSPSPSSSSSRSALGENRRHRCKGLFRSIGSVVVTTSRCQPIASCYRCMRIAGADVDPIGTTRQVCPCVRWCPCRSL